MSATAIPTIPTEGGKEAGKSVQPARPAKPAHPDIDFTEFTFLVPPQPAAEPDEGYQGPVGRLYQPAPSPTQSARSRPAPWVLEFEPQYPNEVEPLMGWTSGIDPLQQVRLSFPSREAAHAYAARHRLHVIEVPAPKRRVRPQSYIDTIKRRESAEWPA